MKFKIERYSHSYLNQTVSMWRDSYEKALGIKETHSIEEHNYFLEEILQKNFEVFIALSEEEDSVIGLIAMNSKEIDQLFIHNDYQGYGIGSELLNMAKDKSHGELSLYTFAVNKKALAFYKKNGFVEIKRGYENVENMEDVLLKWFRK